tara:strand:- start:159 stop:1289 length:1131 start_codon:yes stop_codon:yes gene_type:complete
LKNLSFYLLLSFLVSGCIGTTQEVETPSSETVVKVETYPWQEDQRLTQLNIRDLSRMDMSESLAYEILARPNISKEKYNEAINYLREINNSKFGSQVINTILLLMERGTTLYHLGAILLESDDLDFEQIRDAIGKVYADDVLTSYFFAGLLLSDYETAKSSIVSEEDGIFILINSISLIPDGYVRERLTDYAIDIFLDEAIDDLDVIEAGILAMKDNKYGLDVVEESLFSISENHSSTRIRFAALEALGNEVKTIEMRAIAVMKYDVTSFSVKPGQPVRIILKNEESMPHNIVITEPGSFPDKVIEELAELYGSSDAAELDYIPQTETVLFYTPLIYVNESTTLLFFAPLEEGVYPYVCTYPGHWATMNGVMEVRN